MNSERFHKDLEILKNNNTFNFLSFPIDLHYRISAPFSYLIKSDLYKKKWYQISNTKNWKNYLQLHTDFIKKYQNFLKLFYNIKIIITPSFYYFQDRAWENASYNNNFPYLVFFRESFKDPKSINYYISRYADRNYKFLGSSIYVYNNFEKKCLIEAGVCNSKQVEVLGSPRFDNIIKKSQTNEINEGDCITLFSFRHTIAAYKLDPKNSNDGFSFVGDGAVKLFDKVHGEFARQAILNPKTKFFIKLKFLGRWKEHVEKSIENYNNRSASTIPNLYILDDIDPQYLIIKSNLIIAINSTVLVESRILGKKTAVPVFEEANTILKDFIYLEKFFNNEIHKINSLVDLQDLIKESIKKPFQIKKINNNEIVSDYIGFYDTNHTNRYLNAMKKKI